MPTTYSDGFYLIDPASPPAVNSTLNPVDLTVVDENDDGFIGVGDTINGQSIASSYLGDVVRVLDHAGPPAYVITGVTFYDVFGNPYFTPVDGTVLGVSDFVSVTNLAPGSTPVAVSYLAPPCFAEGTMIASPSGPRRVEDLVPGDTILTADGATTTVLWLGRKTCARIIYGALMQPVRIRAGALGNGLPHADLTVTGDHGMVLDGLVINASALVNGTTIDWVPLADLPRNLTVFHVETTAHDIILANGAPAESFIDYLGRKGFDNYQEYVDLYGAERIIREMDRPRVSTRRLLPEGIRARLGVANGSDSDRDIALIA